MIRIVALLAFVAALGAGCTHNPPPTPVGPTSDASAPGGCAALCQHRSQLGCSTAAPTAAGATCLDVCRNATDPAGPIQWDLVCRTGATDCNETGCQ